MPKRLPDLLPDVVGAWEAGRDDDLADLSLAVQDGTREPSFRAIVISSTGDTLGLQVVGDNVPERRRQRRPLRRRPWHVRACARRRFAPMAEGLC